MKKILAMLLTITMCISMAACGTSCETCNNEKIISCDECVDGNQKCDYCLGDGTNKCPNCGGSGKTTDLTCSACNGEGGIVNPITWEYFECKSCKGLGSDINAEPTSCIACGGDGLTVYDCLICNNTGLLGQDCWQCNGEGTLPCPDCTENQ